MGRSKCDNETIAKVEEALRFGAYFGPACEYAGIGESTAYQWLALAREELERMDKPSELRPPKNPRYKAKMLDFAERVTRASAQREVAMVGVITRAAAGTADNPGDWRAAAFFLERRHPTRWGQQIKQQGTVEIGLSQTLVGMVQAIRDKMMATPALPGQPIIDVDTSDDET